MRQAVLTDRTSCLMQAQVAKCPVCNGSGKYTHCEHNFIKTTSTYAIYYERTCHGCNGKGWVVVPTTYGVR